MDSQRTLLARRAPPEPTHEAPTRRILGRPDSVADGPRELVLGRYRLHERLGAGGFGVVWRASDELLQREVAVKRIPLRAGGDGERATREALACARLSHPAIVALYEACVRDGDMYLISELVEGRTLAGLIADGYLPDRRVLEIGIALSAALVHAHARGVIHRDIKPQNVLVPDRPEQPLQAAKLTDFGGASLAGEDILTRTGDVLGTLAYMAPEQSEGKPAGEPADLYSLALVLYEALSGTNPVRGANPAETARRIGRPVAPLRTLRQDLPVSLASAIDTALAPSPQARGRLEDLGRALEGLHRRGTEEPTRPGAAAVAAGREPVGRSSPGGAPSGGPRRTRPRRARGPGCAPARRCRRSRISPPARAGRADRPLLLGGDRGPDRRLAGTARRPPAGPAAVQRLRARRRACPSAACGAGSPRCSAWRGWPGPSPPSPVRPGPPRSAP